MTNQGGKGNKREGKEESHRRREEKGGKVRKKGIKYGKNMTITPLVTNCGVLTMLFVRQCTW